MTKYYEKWLHEQQQMSKELNRRIRGKFIMICALIIALIITVLELSAFIRGGIVGMQRMSGVVWCWFSYFILVVLLIVLFGNIEKSRKISIDKMLHSFTEPEKEKFAMQMLGIECPEFPKEISWIGRDRLRKTVYVTRDYAVYDVQWQGMKLVQLEKLGKITFEAKEDAESSNPIVKILSEMEHMRAYPIYLYYRDSLSNANNLESAYNKSFSFETVEDRDKVLAYIDQMMKLYHSRDK